MPAVPALLAHAGGADESLSVVMLVGAVWVGWIARSRLKGQGFDRLPRWGAWSLVGIAAALVIGSTFLPRMLLGPTPVAGSTPTASVSGVRIASTATLSFAKPKDGAVVSGKELEAVLDLQGGRIVDATTQAVTPDTGHIHLSIDGSLVSMTYGTVQVLEIGDLAPGAHTVEAEFVAADHVPFDPRVTATLTFVKR
ncbi:MAG: hypothetical protein ACM3OO_03385 [Planctomycetaceae bacterium]